MTNFESNNCQMVENNKVQQANYKIINISRFFELLIKFVQTTAATTALLVQQRQSIYFGNRSIDQSIQQCILLTFKTAILQQISLPFLHKTKIMTYHHPDHSFTETDKMPPRRYLSNFVISDHLLSTTNFFPLFSISHQLFLYAFAIFPDSFESLPSLKLLY